jgi:hypothetical protein
MEGVAKIGVFLLSWVENVDSSIGGVPDAFFVKDDKEMGSMGEAKAKKAHDNAKEIPYKWSLWFIV